MDARRTPTGIVSDHLKDQFTDLLGDPAATAHWISHFAEHGPVQFEPGSMPACDGVRSGAFTFHVTITDSTGLAFSSDFTLTVTPAALSLGGSLDRKSTRLNSSHLGISYAVFC